MAAGMELHFFGLVCMYVCMYVCVCILYIYIYVLWRPGWWPTKSAKQRSLGTPPPPQRDSWGPPTTWPFKIRHFRGFWAEGLDTISVMSW